MNAILRPAVPPHLFVLYMRAAVVLLLIAMMVGSCNDAGYL